MSTSDIAAASTTEPQALLRVARGVLEECRRYGRSTRTLPSTTDALVVHTLVVARARREALPIAVARTHGRLVAERLDDEAAGRATGAVSTWSIVSEDR